MPYFTKESAIVYMFYLVSATQNVTLQEAHIAPIFICEMINICFCQFFNVIAPLQRTLGFEHIYLHVLCKYHLHFVGLIPLIIPYISINNALWFYYIIINYGLRE